MTEALSAHAERMIRRQFAVLEAARTELDAVERERRTLGSNPSRYGLAALQPRQDRAERLYDQAAFTLGLVLGEHPDEAAAHTLEAIVERAWEEVDVSDLLPAPTAKERHLRIRRPADGRGDVERLCARLGWNRQQFYRRAPSMRGVCKINDSKKKSHYRIPDVEQAARDWEAGITKREGDC
jgi:hypothetical protein